MYMKKNYLKDAMDYYSIKVLEIVIIFMTM